MRRTNSAAKRGFVILLLNTWTISAASHAMGEEHVSCPSTADMVLSALIVQKQLTNSFVCQAISQFLMA